MAYRSITEIPCSICGNPAIARHLCRKHYTQAHAQGELQKHKLIGPEDVFEQRYRVMPSGCWEWTGGHNEFGYGIFTLPGEIQVRAHRYSYERTRGPIPEGMVIMHSCDNPPCVNPSHLSLGTKADNNEDCAQKHRRPAGEDHWNARLTCSQIEEILQLSGSVRQTDIARQFGINQGHVSKIISRKVRIKKG